MVPAVSVVRADGSDKQEGIDHLLDLLRRRIDLGIFEDGEADAATAVRASGGYIRDLFRIIRETLQRRDPSNPFPLPTKLLQTTIERMASVTAGALSTENRAILEKALDQPTELIPDEAQRELLFSLYREPLLLRYMNGGCYDIAHPFVLRSLKPELFRKRVFGATDAGGG